MKILIVGGGVAGPALAQFLKDEAKITLIDKAPSWGNIGFAITLWGNGEKILRELGLEHSVLKEGYEVPWNTFEDKKGKILRSFAFDIFRAYGPTTVVTRTALQQALVKNIGDQVKVKMGLTVSNIVQDRNSALVTFSDNTEEKFDLVVGADGIRSQIREIVFGKNFLKYYGWAVHSFWTPPEITAPLGVIEFSSSGKLCFIYPIEDKAVVMLSVATDPNIIDKSDNSRENLHKTFSDFKDSVDHIIDALPDDAPIFRDNLARVDMKDWYKGCVVLVGDAQHAISPLMGMGSSMALEDAYVLAQEIKNNTNDIPLALSRYAKRRSKRIGNFRKASRSVERWTMVESPLLCKVRNFLIKLMPTSYFTKPVKKLLDEKI